MNRADLQRLTELRIREAKALLDGGCSEGAYYLAGYAVECAIKAYVAKRTREHDFPDKALIEKVYRHDPEELVRGAGLEKDLRDEMDRDKDFAVNWAIVKNWSEKSRYNASISEEDARELHASIVDPAHGVLEWLKKRW
ncbi:MAG: HEPN domain-containing protein [Acidobacteria bacterium]|nr:HEPN domain-containing protein [Acidobacteriota bacterium]MBI3662419.1 HEPN domain-containing protein [Acidobacteriota bacterium]